MLDVAGYADPTELVRQARLERGLTQQDLADRLGCTQAAIAQMEHSNNLGTMTLRRVMKELGYGLVFTAVP